MSTMIESIENLTEFFPPINGGTPSIEAKMYGTSVMIYYFTESNGRERVEVIPFCDEKGERVLDRVGQITADPKNQKPNRPVGHVFEVHTYPDTTRWETDDHPDRENLIWQLTEKSDEYWGEPVRDDGSSKCYVVEDSELKATTFKQYVEGTGRTMIGVYQEVLIDFDIKGEEYILPAYLVYRIVTDDGGESERSKEGETQYSFGGFGFFV